MTTLCALLESLVFSVSGPDSSLDVVKLHPLIASVFCFSFLWSLGGNLVEASMDLFDSFIRELFQDNSDIRVGSS